MADRYAGIDWAAGKHDVPVADQHGEELLAGTFVHDEKGLTALCRMLVRMGVVLVAIERPDGLWWSRCWMPGCKCCRCTRTRLRPRVIGSGSRAGSQIG